MLKAEGRRPNDVFAIARARETSSQTMADDVRAIARELETS